MAINDLDLDLAIPRVGPGRQAKEVSVELVRELTVEDLNSPVAKIQAALPIKALRDTHHALARLLATGMGEHEASLHTGYSASRISVLKADPTFQELLAFYRSQGEVGVADFRERMNVVGLTALSVLGERLEEKPDDFNVTQLREIARDMADRTGHAPTKAPAASVNINIGLSERMQAARERTAQALASAKVIDHE